MSVVVLTSATGSPGVTTTALGLALTWPRHVLLADCDREPGQAIGAGYLRGMDQGGRGLMSLAQIHREGTALAPEIWRHTLPLSQEADKQRRFLAGFSTAGSSRLFEHVWGSLGEAFSALDERGVDVIVDAGRISTTGLPLGLLAAADAVVVCVRSSLRSLAAARIHLSTVDDQVRSLHLPRPIALSVIGADRPYSTAEISQQLGVPSWLQPLWDPKLAGVLSDGDPEPRRFHESRFMDHFRGDATALSERLTRSRERTAAVAGGRR